MAIQLATRNLQTMAADMLQSELVNILSIKTRPPKQNITDEDRKQIEALLMPPDFALDKGKWVAVAIERDMYKYTIMSMLEDTRFYEKLKSDLTTRYKNNLVSIYHRDQGAE